MSTLSNFDAFSFESTTDLPIPTYNGRHFRSTGFVHKWDTWDERQETLENTGKPVSFKIPDAYWMTYKVHGGGMSQKIDPDNLKDPKWMQKLVRRTFTNWCKADETRSERFKLVMIHTKPMNGNDGYLSIWFTYRDPKPTEAPRDEHHNDNQHHEDVDQAHEDGDDEAAWSTGDYEEPGDDTHELAKPAMIPVPVPKKKRR